MKPERPFKVGDLVYHGTSVDEDFEDLRGPAWVTDSKAVAKNFVGWNGGSKPRILTYRVTAEPKLVVADGEREFQDMLEWVDEETGRELSLGWDPHELADAVCSIRGVDGWHLPTNFPEGSDTLLCDPGRFLALVNVERLGPRPPKRRNADDQIRRLERAAAQGDEQARDRLHAARIRATGVVPESHRIGMAVSGVFTPHGSVLCLACDGRYPQMPADAPDETVAARCDRCGVPVRLERDDVALLQQLRDELRTVHSINMNLWQTGGMCVALGMQVMEVEVSITVEPDSRGFILDQGRIVVDRSQDQPSELTFQGFGIPPGIPWTHEPTGMLVWSVGAAHDGAESDLVPSATFRTRTVGEAAHLIARHLRRSPGALPNPGRSVHYLNVISNGPLVIARLPWPMPRWKAVLAGLTGVMREHGLRQKDAKIDSLLPAPDSDMGPDEAAFAGKLDAAFAGDTSVVAKFWLYDWKDGRFDLVRKPSASANPAENPGILVQLVPQRLNDDGAAACARSVLMSLGIDIPQAELGKRLNGHSSAKAIAAVIRRGARALGLHIKTIVYKNLGPEELSAHLNERRPVVLRCAPRGGRERCAVACGFDEASVVLMDPALGAFVPVEWRELKNGRHRREAVVVARDGARAVANR